MPSKDPSTTSPVASDSVDEAFAKLGRLQALERLINKIDETDDTIPNNRLKRFPKYVTMHLLDDLDLYPEFVFEHPDEYEPIKDFKGRIIWWGVLPVLEASKKHPGYVDHDFDKLIPRKMNGNLYVSWKDVDGAPEAQFVNRLVERQIEKLQAMDLGDLTRRDYTLKIAMDRIPDDTGNYRIWREFRVSGGLSISALADKVLVPLMGWVRNYHAHAFSVCKDGAVYGTTESSAIDMTHDQSICWGAVPEKSDRGVWTVAHIRKTLSCQPTET